MKRVSEAFDLARDEYITGYDDKQIRIFPTLALVAKELKFLSPHSEKKLLMKDGIRKGRVFSNHEKNLTFGRILKANIPN